MIVKMFFDLWPVFLIIFVWGAFLWVFWDHL